MRKCSGHWVLSSWYVTFHYIRDLWVENIFFTFHYLFSLTYIVESKLFDKYDFSIVNNAERAFTRLMQNYTAVEKDPVSIIRCENAVYKKITGCPLKLFERFKGAVCLAPLDGPFLRREVGKILKNGGGIGKCTKNRSALKTALDTRLKSLLKTRDTKKKEILKNLRNIFPQYFEDLWI